MLRSGPARRRLAPLPFAQAIGKGAAVDDGGKGCAGLGDHRARSISGSTSKMSPTMP